jgi:hypothetical protein
MEGNDPSKVPQHPNEQSHDGSSALRSYLSIDQLSIHVVRPKIIRIDFVPHSVFYNARRTALRTRSDLSSHRIMMQEEAVNAILAENDYRPLNRVWCFDLGVEVDPNFTTRNDNGNEGVSEPVTISEFIHDDAQFQADGKTVWILAIEMTAARRTQAGPSRAQGLDFSAFDPDCPQQAQQRQPSSGHAAGAGGHTTTGGGAPLGHGAPAPGGNWNATSHGAPGGVWSQPAPGAPGGGWSQPAGGAAGGTSWAQQAPGAAPSGVQYAH